MENPTRRRHEYRATAQVLLNGEEVDVDVTFEDTVECAWAENRCILHTDLCSPESNGEKKLGETLLPIQACLSVAFMSGSSRLTRQNKPANQR